MLWELTELRKPSLKELPCEVKPTLLKGLSSCIKDLSRAAEISKNVDKYDRLDYLSIDGICGNIDNKIRRYVSPKDLDVWNDCVAGGILPALFVSWDKFSGDLGYPIPGGCGTYWPQSIGLWSWFRWEGDQLELRLQLMKHMVSELDSFTSKREENSC